MLVLRWRCSSGITVIDTYNSSQTRFSRIVDLIFGPLAITCYLVTLPVSTRNILQPFVSSMLLFIQLFSIFLPVSHMVTVLNLHLLLPL